MTLKRSRDDYHQERYHVESTIAMANYLLMLSQGLKTAAVAPNESRVFECKTCNRKFPSFQALGGHRASHKRPRSTSTGHYHDHDDHDHSTTTEGIKVGKAKLHECSICGVTFSIGQALGGHMRRHRAALNGSLLPSPSCDRSVGIKRNGGSILSLDLNLTPQENGLLEIKTFSPISA